MWLYLPEKPAAKVDVERHASATLGYDGHAGVTPGAHEKAPARSEGSFVTDYRQSYR
jgi:hypothetical protein